MANKVDALINVKDASGVLNEIYPITKKENVQGLAEFISNSLLGYAKKTDLDGYATESEVNTKLENYLPKSGGTLTGTLTGKYISGTWLQATEDNHMANTSAKVAVLDGSGWVYYRTVSELLSDLNIPDSNAIRATTEAYGTTKLSNSVTSTSKTTAATPYAVKSALDTAKKYTDNSIKLAINSSY